MGWDGMRDRNFLPSRVIAGCGMWCVRDGMWDVMEKRPRDGPIYNPGFRYDTIDTALMNYCLKILSSSNGSIFYTKGLLYTPYIIRSTSSDTIILNEKVVNRAWLDGD